MFLVKIVSRTRDVSQNTDKRETRYRNVLLGKTWDVEAEQETLVFRLLEKVLNVEHLEMQVSFLKVPGKTWACA